MDDRTFDGLARELASGVSRRRVLTGLVSGALVGVTGRRYGADAARRGFSGPSLPKPPVTPGPCTPFCSVQLCGIPNGCGGTCTCTNGMVCIEGSCAPPCNPAECFVCITDGALSGCFTETSLSCSSNTDCQAQFGAGICRSDGNFSYCWVPSNLA